MKVFFYLVIILSMLTSTIKPQELFNKFNEKELIQKSFQSRKAYNNSEFPKISAEIKLAPDSLITELVSAINPDSIKMFISGLQALGTRFALAHNREKVTAWIIQKYIDMGLKDVTVDSFEYNGIVQKNIIATLLGKNPKEVCIIGGHYDSISDDSNVDSLAPGADDNASGTSIALEIARVFMQKNYVPECTIKFVNFGTEELGLIGSDNYAKNFYKTGLNLKLMINADMISYSTRTPEAANVAVNYYYRCGSWLQLAKLLFPKYTKLTPIDGEDNSQSSDSYSFWRQGYQTVYFSEDEFSPYYHTTADTLGNYNMPYCAEVMKGACALLINACVIPGPVNNYTLMDVGDGKSVFASWKKSTSNDLKYYKVYIGSETNSYDSTFTTTDTSLTIIPNVKNNEVYIAVSTVTNSDLESSLVENSTVITSAPMTPYLQLMSVSKNEIKFYIYNFHTALSFSGHNVYRADSLEGKYEKINTSLITDSIFIDKTAKRGRYYFYKASGYFSNGAESPLSFPEKARLATLDGGIGLVLTTQDGDGSIGNPTQKQVKDFFSTTLADFSISNIELENGYSTISDIGLYSSLIWYDDSPDYMRSLYSSMWNISQYLKLGGKILISTTLPSVKFDRWELLADSTSFKTGDDIFDYFKISSRTLPSFYRSYFSGGAANAAGYNTMHVDSGKAYSEIDYQLIDIESIEPNSFGKSIYSFSSKSDTCSLNGRSVGVEYMGNDYKTILLSFPLYYMKEDQVKSFLKYVLTNKFKEPVSAIQNNQNLLPANFSLGQNFPNPFNPVTNINFELPVSSKVKLTVFNSIGQQVATLFDDFKSAGKHTVPFNAGRLASGVYFYSLKAVAQNGYVYQTTKKMLLLK